GLQAGTCRPQAQRTYNTGHYQDAPRPVGIWRVIPLPSSMVTNRLRERPRFFARVHPASGLQARLHGCAFPARNAAANRRRKDSCPAAHFVPLHQVSSHNLNARAHRIPPFPTVLMVIQLFRLPPSFLRTAGLLSRLLMTTSTSPSLSMSPKAA